MSLSYPIPLPVPGDDVDAIVLSTIFQSVQQKFGQIDDSDIAAGANIAGSKIAVASLPGDRIGGKTVSQAQQGLGSVGTLELIDLAVTKAKVTTTLGLQLTQAQVAIFQQFKAFTLSPVIGPSSIAVVPTTPIPSSSYQLIGLYFDTLTTNTYSASDVLLSSTVSGGNYQATISVGSGSFSGQVIGNVVFIYMSKS